MITAFAAPGAATLQDLLERLDDTGLPERRRREIASGIRSFARWVGQEPSAIPAASDYLRRKLATLQHASLGIGARRLSNVKSLLLDAMASCGSIPRRRLYLAPMTDDWRGLYDSLPDKYARDALARFMRFASAQGVGPDAVDDGISAAFLHHLEHEGLTKHPRTAHQTVLRLWNRFARELPIWPKQQLTPARYAATYGLPWDTFPVSFHKDVERYTEQLASSDPLAENGPPRPLSASTIASRTRMLRVFGSALVHRGHDPSAITDLTYLLKPEHVRDGLRFYLDRAEGPLKSIHQLAENLLVVAKHDGRVPAAAVTELRKITTRLRARAPAKGLASKNRERLRQFNDRRQLASLLFYAEQVVAKAQRRRKPDRRVALAVQTAVAVELLLYAPMRVANLAGLRLGVHLRLGTRDHDIAYISIPASETKNNELLEYELPAAVTRLLRVYLRTYRPLLCAGGGALFPGRGGQPKAAPNLSSQISKALWRDCGLQVHPHLFRHLAAQLLLRENPGHYEQASRVLGHRGTASTYTYYSGEETRAAVLHFDRTILQLKDELSEVPRRG